MSEQTETGVTETTTTETAPTVETKPVETTTTETKPPAEQKPATEAKDGDGKAADAVDYGKAIAEVKLPEGVVMDDATAKAGAELFGKHKLSAEAVKDLTALYANQIKAGQDASAAAFAGQVGKWKEASMADKDIGGKEGLAAAKQAAARFVDPDTLKLLEHFGLMDHPGSIKAWLKVGKAIKDDGYVPGGAAVNGSRDARALFPKSNMNP
jgi:hypothetical protein